MSHLIVSLGQHSYKLCIGANYMAEFVALIPEKFSGQVAIIITDQSVGGLYSEIVKQECLKIFSAVHVITISGGESAKSLSNFAELCEKILALGITRQSVIIALGGGVIGDLTGYVASSLLRGIPFIQMPTSLLAQVDSSVGGKTGINSAHGKNLIGAFYQPRLVIMNTDWLKTLSIREMRAGYAEIIKYGLLYDAEFYQWLLKNAEALFAHDENILTKAIKRSCEIKAEIVAADEFETTGQRALLNLGHTFAHAFETLCGYDGRLLHGEAVALGLLCAAHMSVGRGFMTQSALAGLEIHLKELGFITRLSQIENLNASADDYIAVMKRDKKATATHMVFILLKTIGQAYVEPHATEAEVRAALAYIA